MAKLQDSNPLSTDEFRQAMRQGFGAIEPTLLSWIHRTRSDGDDDDQFLALMDAAAHYAHFGKRANLRKVAHEAMDLPQVYRGRFRHLAGYLHDLRCGKRITLDAVAHGYRYVPSTLDDPWRTELILLKRTELLVYSDLDPKVSETNRLIRDLVSLARTIPIADNDLLLRAMRSLASQNALTPAALPLLHDGWHPILSSDASMATTVWSRSRNGSASFALFGQKNDESRS